MCNPSARSRGGLRIGIGICATLQRTIGACCSVIWLGFGLLGWFSASSLASSLGASDLAQGPQLQRDIREGPEPGGAVLEPQDLRSHNGVFEVDLALFNQRQQDGSVRYCYLAADGASSPTLRVKPGDLLVPRLGNDLPEHEHEDGGVMRRIRVEPADAATSTGASGNPSEEDVYDTR